MYVSTICVNFKKERQKSALFLLYYLFKEKVALPNQKNCRTGKQVSPPFVSIFVPIHICIVLFTTSVCLTQKNE